LFRFRKQTIIKFGNVLDTREIVVYDNANDEFSYDFEFTVAQSREIEIQVTIPGSSDLTQATNEDELIFVEKDKEMGCVGVLIEHMITPTKGF
jgi:hypothetical protein